METVASSLQTDDRFLKRWERLPFPCQRQCDHKIALRSPLDTGGKCPVNGMPVN